MRALFRSLITKYQLSDFDKSVPQVRNEQNCRSLNIASHPPHPANRTGANGDGTPHDAECGRLDGGLVSWTTRPRRRRMDCR